MRSLILIAIYLLSLAGCTAGWKINRPDQDHTNTPPQTIMRQRALDYENSGELQRALFTWQVAAQLEPDNPDTVQRIEALKKRIENTARNHYQKGLDFYRSGDPANARREFLTTLRLSPDHSHAWHYLKKRLHSTEQTEYVVRRGDSFSKIAKKMYGDPGKAYILAYFNDLNPEKPLLIDTVLRLPALGSGILRQPPESDSLLEQAEKDLEAGHYDQVIAATAEIQKEVPDHPKARSLADRAYWLKARELIGKKRCLDAIAALKQMSADSKDRSAAIRQARKCISKQDLSEKLQTARDHMKKKSYSGAIHMTEEILALDPDNQEARQLCNAGQYALGMQLLEQDENALAIQILGEVDKEFKDIKELMAQARGRLNTQAETLYRNGVKHFIDEELEKAIECWQKALAINPMHVKARQDMENARRLLEKWRGLDQ